MYLFCITDTTVMEEINEQKSINFVTLSTSVCSQHVSLFSYLLSTFSHSVFLVCERFIHMQIICPSTDH